MPSPELPRFEQSVLDRLDASGDAQALRLLGIVARDLQAAIKSRGTSTPSETMFTATSQRDSSEPPRAQRSIRA